MSRPDVRIGLDVHGVIDAHPVTFAALTTVWVLKGYEVHIITGQEWQKAKPTVEAAHVKYTHHFSIVDFHKEQGTKLYKRSDKEGWWMDDETWNSSKGKYANFNVGIHFDDSREYMKYFHPIVTYVIVGSKFEKVAPVFMNL
jgi:hypothetical protein